jgi:type III secretion protein R
MTFMNPSWFIIGAGAIAVIPILLGVVTSYLKVSIVFGLLKNALGSQQVPGVMVTMSLAMAITTYVMAPVFNEIVERYENTEFGSLEKGPDRRALTKLLGVMEPLHTFLVRHVGEREREAVLKLEAEIAPQVQQGEQAVQGSELGWRPVILGFLLTELKEAFTMGFMVLLPFLAIDLIVSNLLVGLGMTMVSPTMISLPLKIILFVLSDGWLVLTRAIIVSYSGAPL